ncbi:hypothetical protein N656DRAFT_778447 [Canariomyces notabilis]|uniref:Uncharacterized protein n=1 Tax=Canariomyces notabilis TaxID=2074819 RepID=A0AAN6TFQ3_9PEZI|nr:hypothetical protein N656DRAFT_778447 [Canariomyces arenarius]
MHQVFDLTNANRYYSHLLDKIQAIGKASLLKERDMLNGKPLPAPIKRRLLA